MPRKRPHIFRSLSSPAIRRPLVGAGVSLALLWAGFAWAADARSSAATAPTSADHEFSERAKDPGPAARPELAGRDASGGVASPDAGPLVAPYLPGSASAAGSAALPVAAAAGADAVRSALVRRQQCDPYYAMEPEPHPHRNFYFARGMYSSGGFNFRGGSWSVDFPKADRQFAYVMERTLGWDIYPCETPVALDDPQLRRYPFLYMLEVGRMGLRESEAEGLREYLLAGGFAFIDDFWGPYQWANFEREITRVLPDHQIEEVPEDHLVFRIVYPIEQVLQVPNVGNGRRGNPLYYGECGARACTPTIRGIFDDDGRLMVLIAHNTDLGDAWEWAEDPYYPYDRSNYAFSLAFNAITYAMAY